VNGAGSGALRQPLLASFSGIPLSFAEAQILPSKKTVKMLRSGLKK
jgi:hypothetical protein